MKKGDKILIQIPLDEKFLEAEFHELAEQKIFNQKNDHVWVIIDEEEWFVPISKIFKKFND